MAIQIIRNGLQILLRDYLVERNNVIAHEMIPRRHNHEHAAIGEAHQLDPVECLLARNGSRNAHIMCDFREDMGRPLYTPLHSLGLSQIVAETLELGSQHTPNPK